MRTIVVLVATGIVAVVAIAVWLGTDSDSASIPNGIEVLLDSPAVDAYAAAVEPYAWRFPDDHGPHPEFQTEWWYYTGNLVTEDNRRFGYQFTIFRRNIASEMAESDSEWRSNQVYMAHFTITDVQAEAFHEDQRYGRGGAQIAGATAEPRYRVWLEDWTVTAKNDDATHTRLQAETLDMAIALDLFQDKPPALQGDNGLSPKSSAPGNASYYYSLSRLATEGEIRIQGEVYGVSGTSWMDHEFSTSALGANAQGWDWFGLQLDDGRDLMVGQIRTIDGGVEPAFGGLLIAADGSTQYLASSDFAIRPRGTWTSPTTGTAYPSGWEITVVPGESKPFTITILPLVLDQELADGGIVYWEGAVEISGDASGYGYAELTGYADTMRGRF